RPVAGGPQDDRVYRIVLPDDRPQRRELLAHLLIEGVENFRAVECDRCDVIVGNAEHHGLERRCHGFAPGLSDWNPGCGGVAAAMSNSMTGLSEERLMKRVYSI